jgi:signal transduction histidine kinase/CheY-like chemotaxis protein
MNSDNVPPAPTRDGRLLGGVSASPGVTARVRDGREIVVGAAALATIGAILACLGGAYALLFDNLQELVAAGGGALALGVAGRRSDGPRGLGIAVAVALGAACLGMLAWDLSHGIGTVLAAAGDVIFVVGACVGVIAVGRAVFGGIQRDRLISVAIDTLIVLLAGIAVVAALWRTSVVAPGDRTASVGAVILISASAGCAFGLFARRVGWSTPGPWLVLVGATTVGASWLMWIGNPAAPTSVDLSDFMFSAGLLLIAYGVVIWDVRPSQSSAFQRVTVIFNSLLPVAAIVGSLGLLAVTRGPDFADLLGAATSAVIVTSAVRQLHLYSRESRARSALVTRTAELQTALASLELEIGERRRLEAEREAMQERMRESQRLESIGRLAGGVAHDFNNLLTAIRGYADLAGLRLPADDEGQADIEAVRHASDQAASLTGQLLAFSRNQRLTPSVVDLGEVVSGAEPLLRRLLGERIELVVQRADDLWPVLVDSSQFESIIVNLAVNARDAMESGGRLTIETANVVLDNDHTRVHAEVASGPYAMVAVSDTGKGMDAATLARIFEPFFTTKAKGKGTGLGLATVYGTVRQSGGYISVSSELRRGTTFHIYMPRTEITEAVDEPRAPVATPRTGHATILVAEDEDAVRSMIASALEHWGYTVLAVRSGEEALQEVEANPSEIGVLLTDVVMPGISGLELIKRARQRRPSLRAICMSGYTPLTLELGRQTQDVTFMAKPFTLPRLEEAIRELLGD